MASDKESAKSVNRSWGGRFSASPDSLVADFTDSQHYDRQLYHDDIKGSIAHARMCAKQGIIKEEEALALIGGLEQIEKEIEDGVFEWKPSLEDVHMNIEGRLVELIGETGKKLHTGRSRNDQVALAFRLFVSRSIRNWQKECLSLCKALSDMAEVHVDTVMPGYTHMQPAQPVSLAQHLLAYAAMFRRDVERIRDALKRVEISPLGSAALAGSTFPLDPDFTARQVGFEHAFTNSMDAVSDRDFALEALFIASAIMMHLSRLCEEIIIWSNPAFGFIRLPDQFATGSSIMPQKKNPDVAELARGKTGRVYGHLMALLTVMKGLPLAYNRDMQEDKEGFLDTNATVLSSLQVICAMLPYLQFNREKMLASCGKGYLNATELADYLAAKGIPFRKAHHITGNIVALAESLNLPLEKMPLEKMRSIEPAIMEDVYACLNYNTAVARREGKGGTGSKSVRRQIEDLRKWLEQFAHDV